MKLGDTFVPISDEDVTHFWILITDPDASGLVVIVSVTTKRNHSDDTCILQKDDHSFIRHESVIAYRLGKLVLGNNFDSALAKQLLRVQPPVSATLLERIQKGALASIYTPRKVKVAVRRQLGITE